MINNEAEKIIDLRNKNIEEIFDIYKDIGNYTELVLEIWRNTNNLETALEVYKQIEQKLKLYNK